MRLFIISFSVLLVSVGSACADTVTLSLPGSYTPVHRSRLTSA